MFVEVIGCFVVLLWLIEDFYFEVVEFGDFGVGKEVMVDVE